MFGVWLICLGGCSYRDPSLPVPCPLSKSVLLPFPKEIHPSFFDPSLLLRLFESVLCRMTMPCFTDNIHFWVSSYSERQTCLSGFVLPHSAFLFFHFHPFVFKRLVFLFLTVEWYYYVQVFHILFFHSLTEGLSFLLLWIKPLWTELSKYSCGRMGNISGVCPRIL